MPLGDVTVTCTVVRVGPAGETAVIEVAELTLKLAALFVPNLTAVTPAKFAPVMVTEVPPAAGPLLGETLLTVGRP